MLATCCTLATPARAVPTLFTVSGAVGAPGAFDAAALGVLPQSTQAVTYRAGASTVSDSFTGPTLWNVLQAAGGITVNPGIKNNVLSKYVIATGADGYATVISAGEISPMFGNRQDLVATSDTGGTLPSPDGFARVVATGDVAGGRYVSNLTSLAVASAPVQPGTGGGPTTQVAVQGAVATPLALALPSLEALPSYTETITYLAGGTPVTDTYTGALLWDVLNSAGIRTDPGIKNDILRDLVTATGSDGYQVSFALGELSPSFGDAPILVAYSDTAGQLLGSAGFARIVVPGDSAGGRYVSNLASLTVFDGTAVPEPASLALLLAGLGLAGLLRQQAVAIGWGGSNAGDPGRRPEHRHRKPGLMRGDPGGGNHSHPWIAAPKPARNDVAGAGTQ